MEKNIINLTLFIEFGDLFQKYIDHNSIDFRILMKTYLNLFTVRYELKESIDFIVNQIDTKLGAYFTSSWDEEKILTMFERKTKLEQITCFFIGCIDELSNFIKLKVKKI